MPRRRAAVGAMSMSRMRSSATPRRMPAPAAMNPVAIVGRDGRKPCVPTTPPAAASVPRLHELPSAQPGAASSANAAPGIAPSASSSARLSTMYREPASRRKTASARAIVSRSSAGFTNTAPLPPALSKIARHPAARGHVLRPARVRLWLG